MAIPEPTGPKKPNFGNVQSGGSTTDPLKSAAVPETRTHTVVKGDTLSKIAKQYYGDANKWREIFAANRDQIEDPDLIRPGQTFKIPSA